MPSETFAHQVHIDAPPADVWARLQVPDTWTGLGPVQKVWDPEWRADGVLAAYRFAASAGPQQIEGQATTREAEAPERLVIGIEAKSFSGELRAALRPNATGTLADIELDIGTSDLLMSLVFGLVAGAIRREFPSQVEGLADQIEGTQG